MKINVAQIYDNISKRFAEITLPQWSSRYFAEKIVTESNPASGDHLGLFEHQANGHTIELKPLTDDYGKTKQDPDPRERALDKSLHIRKYRGAAK